jgi:hypothetical protein
LSKHLESTKKWDGGFDVHVKTSESSGLFKCGEKPQKSICETSTDEVCRTFFFFFFFFACVIILIFMPALPPGGSIKTFFVRHFDPPPRFSGNQLRQVGALFSNQYSPFFIVPGFLSSAIEKCCV